MMQINRCAQTLIISTLSLTVLYPDLLDSTFGLVASLANNQRVLPNNHEPELLHRCRITRCDSQANPNRGSLPFLTTLMHVRSVFTVNHVRMKWMEAFLQPAKS